MTRKSNRPMRKARKTIAKITAVEPILDETTAIIKNIADLPMVKITTEEVLKGTQPKDIQQVLIDNGQQIGINKVHKLIKMAKAEIIRCGEKDILVNFGWAQSNLMDMHKQAVENGDSRQRFVVIQELIKLWGLHRPQDEVKETEITPEMIEEFEQKLLR